MRCGPYCGLSGGGPGACGGRVGSARFREAIEEGSAEVRLDGEIVADLGPGDVFGEIGVAEHGLRSASVVATSPVRLIWFSHWDVRRLRKALPEADRRLAELIEQRRR